jgi:hypothetical protein
MTENPPTVDPAVEHMRDVEQLFNVLHLTTREEREGYHWDVYSERETVDPDVLVITRLSNSSVPFPIQD